MCVCVCVREREKERERERERMCVRSLCNTVDLEIFYVLGNSYKFLC